MASDKRVKADARRLRAALAAAVLLLASAESAVAAETDHSGRAAAGAVSVAPIVIAHRGCWQLAPENSIAALEACVPHGVGAVEADIRPAKDGKFYILHDATLDRTTSMTGALSDHDARELAGARLRKGSGDAGGVADGGYLPTLTSFLGAARGAAIVLLDIKKGVVQRELFEAVRAAGAQDDVIFLGRVDDFPTFPDWVRKRTLLVVYQCGVPDIPGPCVTTLADALPSEGAFPFAIGPVFIDDRFVRDGATAVRSRGARLAVFTMTGTAGGRDEAAAGEASFWRDLKALGFDIFCTDRPLDAARHLAVLTASVQTCSGAAVPSEGISAC